MAQRGLCEWLVFVASHSRGPAHFDGCRLSPVEAVEAVAELSGTRIDEGGIPRQIRRVEEIGPGLEIGRGLQRILSARAALQ